MTCPCGLSRSYEDCCGRYISGAELPPTAEALMRSRYTAFTRGEYAYIGQTFADAAEREAHAKGAEDWAKSGTFKRLEVLGTHQGGPRDTKGIVEFVATYTQDGVGWDHHETSHFEKDVSGRWLYAGGDGHRHREGETHHHHGHHGHSHGHSGHTVRREGPKVGRNDPCPCGSGQKYKKCHGAAA